MARHGRAENDQARACIGLAQLDACAPVRALKPDYFTAADYPWLRAVLDERARFVGQQRRAWTVRIAEGFAFAPPAHKMRLALKVIDRGARDEFASAVAPTTLRAVLFAEAARSSSREQALSATAVRFGLDHASLQESLFADLAGERRLVPLIPPVGPSDLALLANAELLASLMARALRVRVEAYGNVRAVVRHAKLLGLLCTLAPSAVKDGVILEVSGPFSLFRHTRLYGRALASLVPRLAWCRTYRIEADCIVAGAEHAARLVVCAGDPVLPARELPAFDSKVEERFARGFERLAPDWDVIREPAALSVSGGLFFPDFALRHRLSERTWLLEIVGFWTPEYVRKKMAALQSTRTDNLIVCIDEERACGDADLGQLANLVRYRRRVDPLAILAVVDPLAARAAARAGTRAKAPPGTC